MRHSPRRLSISAVNLSLLALLATSALFAQQVRRPRPPEPPGPAGVALADETLISLDFPGGDITKYVAALRESRPDLSIVLDPEAASTAMPPVSLRNASEATALNVIPLTAAARESNIVVQYTRPQNRPDTGSEVYVVTTSRQNVGPAPPMPLRTSRAARPTTLHVASLREIIDGGPGEPDAMKPETVLAALDTALEILNAKGQEKPVVKFHADSGLLVVQGNEEQVTTVQQVLSEIKRTLRRPKAPDEIGELRTALGAVQKEIESLRKELIQAATKNAGKPEAK